MRIRSHTVLSPRIKKPTSKALPLVLPCFTEATSTEHWEKNLIHRILVFCVNNVRMLQCLYTCALLLVLSYTRVKTKKLPDCKIVTSLAVFFLKDALFEDPFFKFLLFFLFVVSGLVFSLTDIAAS